VGDIDVVYGEPTSGAARFAGLTTAGATVVVPLDGARIEGDDVVLPFPGERLAGAPRIDPDSGRLDGEIERRVLEHFAGDAPTAVVPAQQEDGAEVVLSEEQLLVETQRVPTDRVRLRKTLVEEEITLTVTLRREELVIEREPVGPDEALVEPVGAGGADLDAPLEIVLWAEEPVVTTRSVPTERVRLRRNVVTEDQQITTELRRERAEVDQSQGEAQTP
jgi:uncharacterized protein (TIGR02271 family)